MGHKSGINQIDANMNRHINGADTATIVVGNWEIGAADIKSRQLHIANQNLSMNCELM